MNPIEVVIYMEPVGKGRPRSSRIPGKDGKIQTINYTPDRTAHAENIIRDELLKLKAGKFERPIPLRLIATFFFSRPKSLAKRVVLPTGRPDVDNLSKLLQDAMESFTYDNDSQITVSVIRKRYCAPGQVPRVEIYLAEDKTT